MWGAATGFVSGGLTSNVCFVAGTAVLAASGQVAIETIKAGDLVWAENPETGEKALKSVVKTFVNETDELVHVFVNGEEIITTPEHPFYVPQQGWTGAIQLRAGDRLVLSNGQYVTVERIQHELLEKAIKVYNFEVADYHTYFVGDASVLVHNVCLVKENGVKVESYYPKDHAPAHLHVSGEGAKAKIGLVNNQLKAIKGALSKTQTRVVSRHSEKLISYLKSLELR